MIRGTYAVIKLSYSKCKAVKQDYSGNYDYGNQFCSKWLLYAQQNVWSRLIVRILFGMLFQITVQTKTNDLNDAWLHLINK